MKYTDNDVDFVNSTRHVGNFAIKSFWTDDKKKTRREFYLSHFIFRIFLSYLGKFVREIFILNRRMRKSEKNFCFETQNLLWLRSVERRRGGTMRFYFDLKNLSLLLDKFIHLIFMGRQFKIPGISFAHITHSHPSILYLEFILNGR